MVVTCSEMRRLEAAAVAAGRSEESLMEEAGAALARLLHGWFGGPRILVIYAGKGHNAGDAWVAARHLLDVGWQIAAREIFPRDTWRPLTLSRWERVRERLLPALPDTARPVVLDALLGLGAGGTLRDPLLTACRELNALRLARHGWTVALDGPSGLDLDTGRADPDAVRADLTATIAAAKAGLLADEAVDFVGRLAVVPVPVLEPDAAALASRDPLSSAIPSAVLTPRTLQACLPPRRPFSQHKGQAGRVTLIAGSRGYVGAARLSAAAAVKGGAGLVTLGVPEDIYEITAATVIPEVMVRPYRRPEEAATWPADVLAVGPGLGEHADEALLDWLRADPRPLVLDADGLNALARFGAKESLAAFFGTPPVTLAPIRLLTPHPGEMSRLLEAWNPALRQQPRATQAAAFAEAFDVVLLLKGSRTLIAAPGEPVAANTTGHPGMASGGMGDVLTGLSAALLAQGITASAAARLGSWLLGRAAELALASPTVSPESLSAGDVLASLGAAFEALRRGEF